MPRLLSAFALSLLMGAPAALAQSPDPHAGHGAAAAAPAEAAENPAFAEYGAAMEKMMEAMHGAPSLGDADADFAAQMIPHHQAAVDMAETLLKYGEDPELRALAEEVVSAQRGEIAQLEAWLAAREGKTADPHAHH